MRFTGKDRDEATGLYYFNARWYDAELGRFTSEDPARDGVNWHVYVMNNPLRYRDPTGMRLDDDLETDWNRRNRGSEKSPSSSPSSSPMQQKERMTGGVVDAGAGPGVDADDSGQSLWKRTEGDLIRFFGAKAGFLETPFELELFNKYWRGDGSDYNLSSSVFNDIKTELMNSRFWNNENVKLAGILNVDGQAILKFDASKIGLESAHLNGSIGGIDNVYMNMSGEIVGIKDRYDFDVKWRGANLGTLAVPVIAADGWLFNASTYDVKYGITD